MTVGYPVEKPLLNTGDPSVGKRTTRAGTARVPGESRRGAIEKPHGAAVKEGAAGGAPSGGVG